MAQYTLRSSSFTQNMVGKIYHVGVSNGTVSYGYIFQNDGLQSNGMFEKTNVTDKQNLIQYSSTALIDRDLAYFPRVSQGDFSGGALQTVLLDNTKFMDSNLDIRTPGYVQIGSAWLRKTVNISGGFSQENQSCAFNQDIYFTYGETNGNVYLLGVAGAGAPTSGSPVAASVIDLFTDGASLFAGTATNGVYSSTGAVGTWGAIATATNGTAVKWWSGELGTNGHFLFYSVAAAGGDQLWKIDLNASRPVAVGSQPQVPTGGDAIHIVDVVPYQGGIAILTGDNMALNGFDVWFHDGQNMTRIIRVDGYRPTGMCECLGNLYIGSEDFLTFGGPLLIQVGPGTGFQVVSRPAVPNLFTQPQVGGQPHANAEYVFWPVRLTATPMGLVDGSGAPVGRILAYNTLTGATSFLPNFDNTDFGPGSLIIGGGEQNTKNMISSFGAATAFAYNNGTVGTLQYQQVATENQPVQYQTTGTLVSSKIDFATPAIPKRFRTIEVHHAPLASGEAITVRAFVDQDPLAFTITLTPVPATAVVVNSVTGSTVTTMTFGADTIGRSLYYSVTLQGQGGITTPRMIYTAVEVGGTWVWDFVFDCSSRRRTLAGSIDGQGVTGKDLYFMFRNSYENGNFLTLYLFGGLTYTVAVQSLETKNLAYLVHSQQAVRPDEEWSVHAVLTQVQ